MKVIACVFSLIGLGLLIGSFFLYKNTSSFLEEAAKAEGVVVSLIPSRSQNSTTYKPVFRFKDQKGVEIEIVSSTSSNPPSYSEGEKVEVLYLPADPKKAEINDFFSLWGAAVIVGGLGSVFFLIGAGILLFSILKRRRDEYLKEQGDPIETEFQRVELNKTVTVNGRNPFRIITQWQNPSTAEVHIFESDNLWFDPSDYIVSHQITVFIEQNNPKKYYVDTSFLPNLAK